MSEYDEHPDSPPSPTDGPQERVDESELEPLGHATLPEGVEEELVDHLEEDDDGTSPEGS